MTNYFKRASLLTILTATVHFVFAQSTPPLNGEINSILPVSPEAAALGKFVQTPVSNYTGIPEISIPIYSINQGDIQMGISLNYNSGGNKVDEIASRQGLGWALSAGGAISRGTRGLPDSYVLNTKLNKFVNSQMTQAERDDFLYNVHMGDYDAEPDIYYVNVNNLNCKFFKGTAGEWVVIPRNENIKIEQEVEGYNWVLTDGKGIKYKFKDREYTVTHGTTLSPSGSFDGGYSADFSSWFITEIEDTKGNRVQFFYNGSSQSFISKSAEMVHVPNTVSYNCQLSQVYSYTTNDIAGVRLKSIKFNDGEVKFNVSSARTDLPGDSVMSSVEVYSKSKLLKKTRLFTSYFLNNSSIGQGVPNVPANMDNYRLRLDSVREEINNKALPAYKFDYYYTSGLPFRTSYAQDHWGYYNGENNSNAVSYVVAGTRTGAKKKANPTYAIETLLKQITYPTGGKVSYEYEGNSYSGNRQLTGDELIVDLAQVAGNNNSSDLYFVFEESFTIDNVRFPTGNIKIIPKKITEGFGPGCSCSVTYSLVKPDGSVIYFSGVEPFFVNQYGTYKLRGEILTEFAGNPYVYFSIQVSAERPPSTILENITGPGLRVKQIKKDFISGSSEYIYYDYSDPSTNLSSGQIGGYPEYTHIVTNRRPSSICESTVYSSGSNYPLINTKSSYVGYSMVTVKNELNGAMGKSVYKYTNHQDYGDLNTESAFPFLPNTPQDWKRGLLIEEAHYKKEGTLYNLQRKQKFEYAMIPGSRYIASGVKVGAHTTYSSDGTGFGGGTIGDIVSGLSYTIYPVQSDFFALMSDTLLVKENGQELTTVNSYNYSAANYQLASVKTSSSNNTESVRRIYYPSDYSSNAGSSLLLSKLLSRHIIDVPIEDVTSKVTQQGEKFVSGVAHEYGYFLPSGANQERFYLKRILKADINTGNLNNKYNFLSIPVHYEEKLSQFVNTMAQPTKQLINGSQLLSYKWTANNQYIQAACKNADTSEFYYQGFEDDPLASTSYAHTGIKSNSSRAISVSFTKPNSKTYLVSWFEFDGSKWDVKEEVYSGSKSFTAAQIVDDIRIFPHDSQLTFYTYEPLIGLTSTTDPKGYTTYYQYDEFQRLQYLKDANGNIVKEYSYNYFIPQTPLVTYYNAIKSQVFTRNNCGTAVESSVTYTVPAGKYSSTISQADADNKAQNDLTTNGQAYANANGTCIYYSQKMTEMFRKNGCPTGYYGSEVPYTLDAKAFSSTISQADADNKAHSYLMTYGQQNADLYGQCISEGGGGGIEN